MTPTRTLTISSGSWLGCWATVLVWLLAFGAVLCYPQSAATGRCRLTVSAMIGGILLAGLNLIEPFSSDGRGLWVTLSLVPAFISFPVILLVRRARPLRFAREGRCPECGYGLTGNTSGVCPECGASA